MADKLSIAEEEGMPFEERCAHAHTHLGDTWRLIQNLASADLPSRHSSNKALKEFLGGLSEADRKELAPLAEAFNFGEALAQVNEQYYAQTWLRAVQFTKECFGSDATEFALKMLGRERAGN